MHSEALAQVHEANRLFLTSLKGRDDETLERLGFPLAAVESLRRAEPEELDALAEFPRALFRLRIEPRATRAPARAAVPVRAARDMSAAQILELTILYGVWSICRDSTYKARLFFGFSPREVHELRTTLLSELPSIALEALSIECAFAESAWLWHELLNETRPEVRRQLVLVALQPSIDFAAPEDRVADQVQVE